MVLVFTSTVGVAVGWAAAAVMGACDDDRAIAAAATPPSAESTATAAMTGVRRLMPTPSAATPQASGSPGERFGKTSPGAPDQVMATWWRAVRPTSGWASGDAPFTSRPGDTLLLSSTDAQRRVARGRASTAGPSAVERTYGRVLRRLLSSCVSRRRRHGRGPGRAHDRNRRRRLRPRGHCCRRHHRRWGPRSCRGRVGSRRRRPPRAAACVSVAVRPRGRVRFRRLGRASPRPRSNSSDGEPDALAGGGAGRGRQRGGQELPADGRDRDHQISAPAGHASSFGPCGDQDRLGRGGAVGHGMVTVPTAPPPGHWPA